MPEVSKLDPHLVRVVRVASFALAASALVALQLLGPSPDARAQGTGGGGVPFKTGLRRSTPAQFAASKRFVIRRARGEARPARVLLTEFLPPVGRQEINNCVGWSAAYYAYTYAVGQRRGLTDEFRGEERFHFSPSYLYNQGNGGQDRGMQIATALQILKAQGCCTLAQMPVTNDYRAQPSEAAKAYAAKFVAIDTAHLASAPGPQNIEPMKTFLADTKQPFVVGIPVFSDFYRLADPSGVYNHPANDRNVEGYHAITIIGYDESKRAFRMINSWGTDWGDNGQLWLSEEFVANHAFEAWGFKPGGPKARPGDPNARPWPANITLAPPSSPSSSRTGGARGVQVVPRRAPVRDFDR